MFTGIIESIGKIKNISAASQGLKIIISAQDITPELNIDDSVAVNGICLTVTAKDASSFTVDAVSETVNRSTCRYWRSGTEVNLERGMPVSGRLDGHIVQGHIDGTAELLFCKKLGTSSEMVFRTEKAITNMMVEKGSVAIDGVSLTLSGVGEREFKIAVIPFTLKNTLLGKIQKGDLVNIETDILGKYIAKFMKNEKTLDTTKLRSWGYTL